jgi:phosphate:Na+ symporter
MEQPTTILGAVAWMLGGLGIFLYAIHVLSRAMRAIAGQNLRRWISHATRHPPLGLAVGAVLTGLLQSSSAFTVMVVSFVDAGLVTFAQSISLVLGSAIGSTATAQLLAKLLNAEGNPIDAVALPVMGFGLLMMLFAKRERSRKVGAIFFGFAAIFFGFILMKGAVDHWQATTIRDWLASFDTASIGSMALAVLVGAVATAIVQSSGATIGIIIGLANEGVLPSFAVALPLVVGCQIGTTITAVLAAIGTTASAKRVAALNVLFRILGGGIALCCMQLYTRYIGLTSTEMGTQIANFHTIHSVIMAVVFLPFAPLLAWLLQKVVRGDDSLTPAPKFLDFSGRTNHAASLEQAKQEALRIGQLAQSMVLESLDGLLDNDEAKRLLVQKKEDILDVLDDTTSDFIVAHNDPSARDDASLRGVHLLQVIHHMERVGDHAENITEMSRLDKRVISFLSREKREELRTVAMAVETLASRSLAAIANDTRGALSNLSVERLTIKTVCRDLLSSVHAAVEDGKVSPLAALVYEDVLVNLESCGNHFKKAVNAYYGFPLRPDDDEITLNIEENT